MKRVLVGLMVLWSVAAIANAAQIAGKEVGVTVDATYTSKYIWRGFDMLDDVSAWQPSVNFDLGNGFSANLWMSYAGAGGETSTGTSRVDLTQYNYTLAYSGTLNESCPWKTDYKVGWRYYDFIKISSEDRDLQEGFLEMSMPELIGGGVTPHAAYYQMWVARSDNQEDVTGGAIFLMGFNYDFTLQQTPKLPMTFGWDIVYNDGTGLTSVDHDWSHMVWSLKTSMKCPMTGATITPAVYFQNSMDKSVNTEDELWASLSYTFKF